MRMIIEEHAHLLNCVDLLDAKQLLGAIAMVESDGGRNEQMNFEQAFYVDGKFDVPALRQKWQMRCDPVMVQAIGRMCASSWGPWQIMFPVAVELGFTHAPWILGHPSENIKWAIKYLNRRAFRELRGNTIRDMLTSIGDSYNSGSNRDRYVPEEYIERLIGAYTNPDLLNQLRVFV